MSLSSGTLSPTFASGVKSYYVTVSNTITSVRVTATLTDTTATFTIEGITATSAVQSSPINLIVGNNSLEIVATAQDSVTINTYIVVVNRAPCK